MDPWIRLSWAALAALHLPPAAVLASPALAARLYGVAPDGTLGVLVRHRGALFLAVVGIALVAAFDPGTRRAGTLALAISMVGFLALYAHAGLPPGSLRRVALADLVGLVPLAAVTVDAWMR